MLNFLFVLYDLKIVTDPIGSDGFCSETILPLTFDNIDIVMMPLHIDDNIHYIVGFIA